MDAQIEPQLSPTARRFLEETTMKSLFGISDQTLDAVMALAYQLHRAGRDAEVLVLCRGLLAADHKYWWSYALHASALCRLGRFSEALTQLERGLAYEPQQPKLLAMRGKVRDQLARQLTIPVAANETLPAAA